MAATPQEAAKRLGEVLEELDDAEKERLKLPVVKVETVEGDDRKAYVKALSWTPREWMDILEVCFTAKGDGACEARVQFYATGLVPTSVPGAPVINTALFFFPFGSADAQGQLQPRRIDGLRQLLDAKVGATAL